MGNCQPSGVPFPRKDSFKKPGQEQYKDLRDAVRQNDVDLVRLLIEEDVDPNVRMQWGFTALHFAAEYACDAMVKTLLDAGCDPNIRCDALHGGLTPLIIACSGHHCHVVAILLQHGADVNMTDIWGNTALLKATYNKCKNCVTLLSRNHADPNMYNKWNCSPLHQAARLQDTHLVRLHIESGSDVNHPGDQFSLPPLFLLAKRNDEEGMKMLLDAGADFKIKLQTNHFLNGSSLFSFLVDSRSSHAAHYDIKDDAYPRCIERLVHLGVNVAQETYRYIRLKAEYNIYTNNHFSVAVLELVLRWQGFEYNSETLRSIVTNVLAGNGEPLKSEQFLPLLLSIGLAPTQEHVDFFVNANKDDKLTVLRNFRKNPRTLKDICRLKIRLCIYENVPFKGKQLPLPTLLQEYISIVSPFHFSTW